MSARSLWLALAVLAAGAASVPPAHATDLCAGFVCLIDQPVLQAVMGERHQCFLLADGDVVCAGVNDRGQATGRGQKDGVALAAGAAHTCVLLRSGAVDCFGYDADGQARDRAGDDAVAIDAGALHTCAVLRSGNVDCWGLNAWGQSVDWLGGHVVDVDVTTYYTCALFDDGNVDCWGSSDEFFGIDYGYRLGDAVGIGGGDQHTCVVLAAGNVRCWGTAHWGAMDPYDGGDAVAVDGGYDATCILTTSGDVRCQGRNTSEDGSCGSDLVNAKPLRCEGLESGRDRRSRDDGRVRSMMISIHNTGACYVLDDASAECQGGLSPLVEPEPSARNEVAVVPRGIAVEDPAVRTPALPIDRDTRVTIPVRVCPLPGTCIGYIDIDPGVGPIDTEVPATEVIVPVDAGARVEGTVRADSSAGTPVEAAGGPEADACLDGACAL